MEKKAIREKKGKPLPQLLQQSKLVGNLILADFLQYPLEKFMNFITAVEGLPLYKELTGEGIIIRKPLLGAKILEEDKESVSVPCGDGVIAKIKKAIQRAGSEEQENNTYI